MFVLRVFKAGVAVCVLGRGGALECVGFCVNLWSVCVGWLAVVCAALWEVEAECGNRLSRESKSESKSKSKSKSKLPEFFFSGLR